MNTKSGTGVKVLRELRRIAKRSGGVLQPEDVVREAEPEKSPLHSQFTWDDTEAGRKYRLLEARQLISAVVKYIRLNGKPTPIRVFVSLSPDRAHSGGYREMADVLRSEDMRRVMLADALDELRVFQEKYSHLKELASVFREASKVLSESG